MLLEAVDAVFDADPADEGGAEGEVEEAFVLDGEDDEDGGEGEEEDDEAVDVVGVGLEHVEEGNGEGGEESDPADDLGAEGEALACLERGDRGARD